MRRELEQLDQLGGGRHGRVDVDPRPYGLEHDHSARFGAARIVRGAILLFPTTMDMQAPAYRQALTACGAPPLGLRH